MGILDELTSATGEKESNRELVKRCIQTPALLHTVAEGLRTGTPKARVDCAQILADVAQRQPELLSAFVTDLLDASKSDNKRVSKSGFAGLANVVLANPAEVYAEREHLLQVARGNDADAMGALSVLAALCGNNPNYRGKLLGSVLRLLNSVADADLPKWVQTLGPAVEGSSESMKKLRLTVDSRRAALAPEVAAKLDQALKKLERVKATVR